MASTDPSRPRTGLTGYAWLLLGLASVLYLVMMGNISAPASGDPNTGRIVEALEEVFHVFFTLMLWILLAILLLAGGVAGEMRIVAASLLLLSGVAVICAGVLSLRYHGWAIVVAASLPPLIALYAMWACLPALHAALPARVVNVAIGGAIVMLTMALLPLSVTDAEIYAARQRQQEAERAAWQAARDREAAQERARDVVRFQGLTADSPLGDFLYDLTFSGRDVDWPPDVAAEVAHHYDQALAKERQVKTRQTDAVTLLKLGRIGDLKDLWQLDIEATPAVCEAYRDALRNDDPRLQNLFDARDALELQLPNIKWFVGEHAISTTLWPCS